MVGGVDRIMNTKTYTVSIKMIGPVFIGGGETLKKQNYIYDFHKSKVHMINGPKFVKFLKAKGLLKQYQEFLRYPSKAPREQGLKYFLDKNIRQNEWGNFISHTEQVHQGKRSGNNQAKPLNDIQLIVRDGQGKVYIPGSSLKGALRTILESNFSGPKLEYNKIVVSDSKPIDEKNLAIYEKIDINKRDKPMPLYRECLDIDTEVEMILTIKDNAISIEDIEKSIRQFYKNYFDKWLSGFKSSPGGKEFALKGGIPENIKEPIIYLGGGVGFVSKTTHYQNHDKETDKKEAFNVLRNKFRKTYGKFKYIPDNVPIALKGTVNQSKNEWYQQGMCTITFNEMIK